MCWKGCVWECASQLADCLTNLLSGKRRTNESVFCSGVHSCRLPVLYAAITRQIKNFVSICEISYCWLIPVHRYRYLWNKYLYLGNSHVSIEGRWGDTVKQLIADICRRSGNAYCFNLRHAMKWRIFKEAECSQFDITCILIFILKYINLCVPT